MTPSSIPRRDFLKTLSLALPLSASGMVAADKPLTKPHYWNKNTRLTISMWDFSWLQASHPGGAFEDLERRVVEAKERGYNTLRVDCFPSRVLEKESEFVKNWNPSTDLPQWGQRAVTFRCDVRRKFAQLAGLCRKHGIWLGLDSWDKGHMFSGSTTSLNGDGRRIAEADEEREFRRYADTWVKAIKLLREDGVLERAVWIAPMNEVPHFAGRHLASLANLRVKPRNEGETQLTQGQQEDAIYQRINHWMAEAIGTEVAREGIPISYSSLGAEDYSARLTDVYDVVDVHFMPGVIADAEDAKAFELARKGASGARFSDMAEYDLKAWSSAWDNACRKHHQAMLDRTREYHRTALSHLRLPSGKQLGAIITESFGPCFWPDHPDVSWEWYKRYNAGSLGIVAGMDFKGSSLSNYAEPIFSLWKDADWHRASNACFLSHA